ncbi:hypothetical protein EAH89_16375 [Roseomonas nepalensis]|uniref:Uncharacterized protein n=1 Tax=Muricoccus nepalensis TaxID=1854500 RepID=A0A502FW02_9PROT|nr:hypothetical protein [Roseomonas nepalensis]TPG53540.1 hypothetical protein EAH89_16375 [Roseomonas nepalensis]
MRVLQPGRDYFPPRVLLRGDRPALAGFRPAVGTACEEGAVREDGPAAGTGLPVAAATVIPAAALPSAPA